MKKALTITVAGTLFTIEEDAYQKLDGYLKSINTYFGSNPDSQEIINDIEARIAEQLLERENKSAVVTIDDVEKVIQIMGRVEDFDDATSNTSKSADQKTGNQGNRKLYRDTENGYIAGVAAGMAAYLDIDPIIVRIAFFILMLITAFVPVVIIYAILAIIIPPARTASEKLQMRGGPVNLQSFKESMDDVKENINRTFKEGSGPRNTIEKLFRMIGRIVRVFVKATLALVGLAVTIMGIIAISFATFVFVNLIVNRNSPYIDFPLQTVLSGPLYYLTLIAGFAVIAIPMAFIINVGTSMITRRKTLTTSAAVTMLGVWIAAIIVAATIGFRYAPLIPQQVLSSEEYQQISKDFEVTNFSKVDLMGGDKVTIVPSDTFSVTSTGKKIDVDSLRVHVDGDTVSIYHFYGNYICIFCWERHEGTEITIGMPTISGIEAGGATNITNTATTTSAFTLTAHGASLIDTPLASDTVDAKISGASRIRAQGTAKKMELHISGASEFTADKLVVENAEINASGASKVRFHVTQTLKADASGASKINYIGNPSLDINDSGAAEVERLETVQ